MEMETYIQEQRHQGTLESEGAFSVDTFAAFRITLASALPEPHYYLFLILQGLLAAKAERVEVAIGRHSTRFGFEDTQAQLTDLEAIQERVGRGLTLASSRPEDMVLVGMATSVGQEMDRADLSSVGPQDAPAPSLQLSPQQIQIVAQPERRPRTEHSSIVLHRNIGSSQSFAWTRVWGARREEGEVLRRFEHSEPPIKVAGLPTSPRPLWSALEPVGESGPLILLEAAVLAEPDAPAHRAHSIHPMLPAPNDLGEEISPELNARLTASFQQGEHDLPPRCLFRRAFSPGREALHGEISPVAWQRRRWTVFFTSRQRPETEFIWIRHGLTLERERIDLGWPGLYVIAPAEDLDMDASGFGIVANARYEQRLQEAKEMIETIASSLSKSQVEQLLQRLEQVDQMPAIASAFPWLED